MIISACANTTHSYLPTLPTHLATLQHSTAANTTVMRSPPSIKVTLPAHYFLYLSLNTQGMVGMFSTSFSSEVTNDIHIYIMNSGSITVANKISFHNQDHRMMICFLMRKQIITFILVVYI